MDKIVPYEQLSVEDRITIDTIDTIAAGPINNGFAAVWSKSVYDGGHHGIHWCQIRKPVGLYRTSDSLVDFLTHELGHCLDLDHVAPHPHDARQRWGHPSLTSNPPDHDPSSSPIWGKESIMAYRPIVSGVPTLDDEVGASVVRLLALWRQKTGSTWGAVFIGGEPARGVYVLASTVAASTGDVGAGVGGFTNAFGTFAIKGLDPGRYALWVYDTFAERSYSRFWMPALDEIDADPHVHDTILGGPVVVTSGGRTGPIFIPVRRPGAGE